MKSKQLTWIEIGIEVAKDKNFTAFCPKCNLFKLKVFDVRPDNDSGEFARYIVCPGCDESNVLTMKERIKDHELNLYKK